MPAKKGGVKAAKKPAAGVQKPKKTQKGGAKIDRARVVQQFMAALQTGKMDAALKAGICIVEEHEGTFHEGPGPANAGMQATLASLLVGRGAPGDFAVAVALTRKVLANLPPAMADARPRLQCDLAMALVKQAGEEGPDAADFEARLREAFTLATSITSADEEASALKCEVLSSLYMTVSPMGKGGLVGMKKYAGLQEDVCRQLVKWDKDNAALARYNLGAVLCRQLKVEEGAQHYEAALKLARGDKTLSTQIKKDLEVLRARTEGGVQTAKPGRKTAKRATA